MSGFAGPTINFATISTSASADIVAAVTGKVIQVRAVFIVVTTAVTVKFQTGATTDITGAMPLGANGGFVLPYNEKGWFQTASGAKLNLVLGSGVATAGGLVYVTI